MKKLNIKGFWLGLIALFVAQSALLATGTPPVVDNFIAIFIALLQGQLGVLLIVIILLMSAFTAWRSGNLTHLFWGLAAAIIIGAAPRIADGLILFSNTSSAFRNV